MVFVKEQLMTKDEKEIKKGDEKKDETTLAKLEKR
jgi:hypothetical protein